MTQPKLSFIIASRNDDHGGKPMERLNKTIEQILKFCDLDSTEIITVDWGSQVPISQATARAEQEQIIYVPPYITQQYPPAFNEVLALNIGVRRAKGEWIARLDQDILVTGLRPPADLLQLHGSASAEKCSPFRPPPSHTTPSGRSGLSIPRTSGAVPSGFSSRLRKPGTDCVGTTSA